MFNQWKLHRKTINSEILHFVLLSIFWSVHIFKYSYAKVHLSKTSNQILLEGAQRIITAVVHQIVIADNTMLHVHNVDLDIIRILFSMFSTSNT